MESKSNYQLKKNNFGDFHIPSAQFAQDHPKKALMRSGTCQHCVPCIGFHQLCLTRLPLCSLEVLGPGHRSRGSKRTFVPKGFRV